MRILVIGGTKFVGRHLVTTALHRGHEVTLFHRGQTGAGLFPSAVTVPGDRNSEADLEALASGSWDVTIDTCAYVPRQVEAVAGALGKRAGRYALISTVSVYADPPGPGITEDAPLIELEDPSVEAVTEETYGGLKVLCERAAAAAFGEDLLVVRPTYVVGPYDHTGRFTWWVRRVARGGEVLAPGPLDCPVQVIDARDQATWVISLLEDGTSGVFHAASPAPPFGFGDLLQTIAAEVAPEGTSLSWVDEPFLLEAGEDGASLPMWAGGDSGKFLGAVDPSRAMATGLDPRPLRETVRDTLEHHATPLVPGAGLPPEREAELLARWRRR